MKKWSINKKHIYFLLICSFLFIMDVYSKNTEEKKREYIFLLDNKRVSESEIEEKMKKDEIVFVCQAHTPREAISMLGEKYREPIIIFETKNKSNQ